MNPIRMLPLLRLALRLDGAVSGLAGIACLLLAGWLAGVLGAPDAAVLAVGAFLMIYGASLLVLASLDAPPRLLLWGIVGGNALWVLGSVALALSDWISPGTLGLVLLLGQAMIVFGFTELQYLGLRRSLRQATA